jgi:transaldolase
MTGRLDVYLDDIAADLGVHVGRDGVIQAGNAVAKRAYDIYRERGYEATLLIAGLRGIRHVEQMAGAEVVISISPAFQEALRRRDVPKIERYEEPVDPALIDTMRTIPEFNRIYEPDGMAPEEFMAFGLTQRTLAQFTEAGWGRMLAHKFSP